MKAKPGFEQAASSEASAAAAVSIATMPIWTAAAMKDLRLSWPVFLAAEAGWWMRMAAVMGSDRSRLNGPACKMVHSNSYVEDC